MLADRVRLVTSNKIKLYEVRDCRTITACEGAHAAQLIEGRTGPLSAAD